MNTQENLMAPRYAHYPNDRISMELKQHTEANLRRAEERERELLEKHILFDDVLDIIFAFKAKLQKFKTK